MLLAHRSSQPLHSFCWALAHFAHSHLVGEKVPSATWSCCSTLRGKWIPPQPGQRERLPQPAEPGWFWMGDGILLLVLGHGEIWILIINQLCIDVNEKAKHSVSSGHFWGGFLWVGIISWYSLGCIIKLNSIKWKFRRQRGRSSTTAPRSTPAELSSRLTGVLSATTSSRTTLTITRIIFSLEWGTRNVKKVLRKVSIPQWSTAKVKLRIFGNPMRKVSNIILKSLLKHIRVMLLPTCLIRPSLLGNPARGARKMFLSGTTPRKTGIRAVAFSLWIMSPISKNKMGMSRCQRDLLWPIL